MSYIGNIPTTVAFLVDTFSGDGSDTTFTLSQAPANTSSILVAVSGVVQDPSTYSVSGTTLTFSGAPPSGSSNISVRFLGVPASGVTTTAYRTLTTFTATSGQTTFSVPSYTVGYIDVYRNGVKLGIADFTATSGTSVVLASGATAGDLVETISFFVSSVLNAIPAVANAVTETYINTGAVTQSKLGAGVAGNGPAFRGFTGYTNSISNATNTQITATFSVTFDTASAFSTGTGRFTPQVAGYYQVTAYADFGSTGIAASPVISALIFKNGVVYNFGGCATSSGTFPAVSVTDIVFLNGTTDYITCGAFQLSGGTVNNVRGGLSICLARAA
jgi:hypothetical protein